MTKIPPNAEKHCTRLDCPERLSFCCGAKSEPYFLLTGGTSIKDREVVFFMCGTCGHEFKGGKCTAGDFAFVGGLPEGGNEHFYAQTEETCLHELKHTQREHIGGSKYSLVVYCALKDCHLSDRELYRVKIK